MSVCVCVHARACVRACVHVCGFRINRSETFLRPMPHGIKTSQTEHNKF